MSVRAYKIITKDIEDNPSFNLWHDDELMSFFERYEGDGFTSQLTDGGGTIEIQVSIIKKALKVKKLWEKEDYRTEQLKKDIDGKSDDDFIEYECF